MKVLTSYSEIEGVDVQYELTQARDNREDSPVTQIINQAKKEAYDYLVPAGIDAYEWTQLEASERFFIKGFEANLNGDFRNGTFQELARSFGIVDYKNILGNTKANQVRFKTPSEFGDRDTGDSFNDTLLRQLLLALHIAVKNENALEGRKYLKGYYDTGNTYWTLRTRMKMLLGYLSKAGTNANLPMWKEFAEMADILMNAIANDMV